MTMNLYKKVVEERENLQYKNAFKKTPTVKQKTKLLVEIFRIMQ